MQCYVLCIFFLAFATFARTWSGDTGCDGPTLCHKEVSANHWLGRRHFETISAHYFGIVPQSPLHFLVNGLGWLCCNPWRRLEYDVEAGKDLVNTRLTFGWIFFVPVCLDIDVTSQGEQRQVQVIGYANTFWITLPRLLDPSSLVMISISTQLTGQLILALAAVALIAFLEVLDNVRDVKGTENGVYGSGTPWLCRVYLLRCDSRMWYLLLWSERKLSSKLHLLIFKISHNWSDTDCIRILTNIRKAMVPHSRVLVCESTWSNSRYSNFFLDRPSVSLRRRMYLTVRKQRTRRTVELQPGTRTITA